MFKGKKFHKSLIVNSGGMPPIQQQDDEDDGAVAVEYVQDDDSSILNRYNRYTRTFFKCSIYSPSN
jgi:hypothetical protein